jgi:hypothetical protein
MMPIECRTRPLARHWTTAGLAWDYGESQRRIWTRRRVSEARRSTSAGSSRGRTILLWRRVCDDWVARLDRALARESQARCGRLRGSACRARLAPARDRLRGCAHMCCQSSSRCCRSPTGRRHSRLHRRTCAVAPTLRSPERRPSVIAVSSVDRDAWCSYPILAICLDPRLARLRARLIGRHWDQLSRTRPDQSSLECSCAKLVRLHS